MSSPGPVYQPRCVHCGLEHYVLNVPGVSTGEAPCHNCGRKAPVFETWQEYTDALKAMWEAE